MSRVYVGNLDARVTERDLEDEFRVFGVLRSVWVARRPPGYAFIEFDDHRDAGDAIRALDGKNGWRVELSRSSRSGGGGGGGGGGRGRGRGGGDDLKCYECGEPGHFARECRLRVGSGGLGSGRRRTPSPPRYRRSPSYGRSHGRRNRSPSYSPYRGSYADGDKYGRSPRKSRSPRRSSYSPRRGRSYSRSPPRRRDSPYANGSPAVRESSQSPAVRERTRSPVPRDRSRSPALRVRSHSPALKVRSRSPVVKESNRSHDRRASPYTNGSPVPRNQSRSRS